MAIILEGPDAAGKSTLARTLAKEFGFRHVISAGAPKGEKAVLAYCVSQLNDCEDRGAVIDRITPISHPIYNLAYVGNEMLEEYLHQMLKHPETVLVYCRPSTEALMRPERHAWKDWDFEASKKNIIENQHTFIARYDEFFRRWPHIAYNYDLNNEDIIALLGLSKTSDEAIVRLKTLMQPYKPG